MSTSDSLRPRITYVLTLLPLLCIKVLLVLSCSSMASEAPKAPTVLLIHTDNSVDFKNLEKKIHYSLSNSSVLLVTEKLPYKIQFEYMSTLRSMMFLNKKQNICIANRIKTPDRAAKFLFSKPVNLYLNKRLFQQAQFKPLQQPLLNPNGEIDLSTLFKTHPLRTIVINTNISHGPVLDRQLAALPAQNKLIRNSPAHEGGLIKMLNRNRVDYLLLFPQQYDENAFMINDVISYPVAGIPNYIVGHFMCSNTEKMQQVIKTINQVLDQIYADNSLFELHFNRLRESEQADFKRYYQQVFKLDKEKAVTVQ